MATILHFADLHLDTGFPGLAAALPPERSPRHSLRRCLEDIVTLAQEERVDALTIAGDLYEHDHRDSRTWHFVAHQLGRIPDIPVLIAPGNHDPCKPSSLYRAGLLPANVHVFAEPALSPFPLGRDVAVWGAGWADYTWSASPLANGFRAPADGCCHLLLLHATVTDRLPRQAADYCPIREAEVRDAGFRAALLGHLHGAYLPGDGGIAYYPGSPQPLTFREDGGHYALLFDVDDGRVRCRPLAVSPLRLGTADVAVEGAATTPELADAIAAEVEGRDLAGGLARVRLSGSLHPDIEIDWEGLQRELARRGLAVTLVDETQPAYDYRALARGPTSRARFVSDMLALLESAAADERPLLEDALALGLRALEGKRLRPCRRPAAVEEDKER